MVWDLAVNHHHFKRVKNLVVVGYHHFKRVMNLVAGSPHFKKVENQSNLQSHQFYLLHLSNCHFLNSNFHCYPMIRDPLNCNKGIEAHPQ